MGDSKRTQRDGAIAYGRGEPVTSCGLPDGGQERASWVEGWQTAERMDLDQKAREDRSRQRIAPRQHGAIDRRRLHDSAYPAIADKLASLGIDPYQLRDYLAGLPEDG